MRNERYIALAAALVAVLWMAMAYAEEPATGIPDGEISLYPGSVFEVVTPDAVSDPLELGILPRSTDEVPPIVGHTVSDYMPITRAENLCIECHLLDVADEGETTPIPQSHYVDDRRAPDAVGETLAGARYVCVSCHVEQTDAQALVGNSAAFVDTTAVAND